jgi:hypothetical protein
MKPLAIFHHCRVSGGEPPIDFTWSIGIVAEQIIALRDSGLTAAASEYYIGVNGGEDDAMAIASLAPDKADVIQHPAGSKGEHPTMRMMQEWCLGNPDAYVLYFHTKSATHPKDPLQKAWRLCCERAVIHSWEQCVRALDGGYDAAGPHWVEEGVAVAPVPCYFAGNFWWAKSAFINTIPLIAHTAFERLNFYDAEVLIARGPRPARAFKLCRHWPGAKCLAAMKDDPSQPTTP